MTRTTMRRQTMRRISMPAKNARSVDAKKGKTKSNIRFI